MFCDDCKKDQETSSLSPQIDSQSLTSDGEVVVEGEVAELCEECSSRLWAATFRAAETVPEDSDLPQHLKDPEHRVKVIITGTQRVDNPSGHPGEYAVHVRYYLACSCGETPHTGGATAYLKAPAARIQRDPNDAQK